MMRKQAAEGIDGEWSMVNREWAVLVPGSISVLTTYYLILIT